MASPDAFFIFQSFGFLDCLGVEGGGGQKMAQKTKEIVSLHILVHMCKMMISRAIFLPSHVCDFFK